MESGQSLREHRRAILRSKGVGYHLARWGLWIVTALIGGVVGYLWGSDAARVAMGPGAAKSGLIGMAIGAIAGLLWGRFPRLWLCQLGVI